MESHSKLAALLKGVFRPFPASVWAALRPGAEYDTASRDAESSCQTDDDLILSSEETMNITQVPERQALPKTGAAKTVFCTFSWKVTQFRQYTAAGRRFSAAAWKLL